MCVVRERLSVLTTGTTCLRRSAQLLVCLALLTAFAGPAVAQANQPAYQEPAEREALNAIVQTLRGAAGDEFLPPADLIELSRLLSTPCDQARWLVEQVRYTRQQPNGRAAAQQLAEAASERWTGLLSACGDELALLDELIAQLQATDDITDPDALRQWMDAQANYYDLEAYVKFTLLSRGVPTAKLIPRRDPQVWDAPRTTLASLTSSPDLAAFPRLLALRNDLIAEHATWTSNPAGPISLPEQRQAVDWSFQIAAALLDRAIGVDATDRAATASPIPYTDTPQAWSQMADRLEQDNLRIWSALARLLSAGDEADSTARQQLAAQVTPLVQAVRAVDGRGWDAVADPQNGWAARAAAGRYVEPARLPLTSTFRGRSRQERAAAQATVEQQLSSAGNVTDLRAADALFASIQRAKAAELGVNIAPLSIAQLKSELGESQLIYLFVEMFELRGSTPGSAPRYCGVAVYREQYAARMATVEYTDQYLQKIIPPQTSPEQVLRVALAAPGPPAGLKDPRIIIASDAPLTGTWFGFEQGTLLAGTEWRSTTPPSWVIYMPSATVLTTSAWTLDESLRTWYRAALQRGVDLPSLAASPTTLRAGAEVAVLSDKPIALQLVSMEEGRRSATSRFMDLMNAKRGTPTPLVPLCVNTGR